MRRTTVLFAFLALLAAGPAHAGGPSLLLGVTDDGLRGKTLVQAKANVAVARALGVRSIRLSTHWWKGMTEPDPRELGQLGNVVRAARLSGLTVFLAYYPNDAKQAPVTEEERQEFVSWATATAKALPYVRDAIIGNEPNINTFWLPQFNLDGTDAAAEAYHELLADTYDGLKAVDSRIRVIGGALSPRGADNPSGLRPTHSPTQFIRDLGLAYRASGRRLPIMDQFAIHPYQDSSRQAPTTRHPTKTIAIADYAKLVRLLGEAFDGTAQLGSTMPIVYAEYGVESLPPAAKAGKYTGTEPRTTHPVSGSVQAAFYRQAMQLAFCQPTVRAFSIFSLTDDVKRQAWQSGLRYVDGTLKPSFAAVKRATGQVRRGVLARCPGLALKVRAAASWGGRTALATARPVSFRLRCDIDCGYVARLVRLPGGATVVSTRGRAVGRVTARVRFPSRKLKRGRYRVEVSAAAPVNPGPQSRLRSPIFQPTSATANR